MNNPMMPIEKQVVSLELSKRLKELGCKQESLFWWVYSNEYIWSVKSQDNFDSGIYEHISAFTYAELGEMISNPDTSLYSNGLLVKEIKNVIEDWLSCGESLLTPDDVDQIAQAIHAAQDREGKDKDERLFL